MDSLLATPESADSGPVCPPPLGFELMGGLALHSRPRYIPAIVKPESHADDKVLVDRVLAGDSPAYDTLVKRAQLAFRRAFPRVSGRAPWIVRERDDLEQRFLLMLIDRDHRVLRNYSGKAALTTWLHPVAVRFLHRQATLLKRQGLPNKNADILDTPAPAESTPEAMHAARTEVAILKHALDELQPRDRLLLQLVYDQDIPAHAAGESLGLSASGVRMRKKRLLEQLGDRLRGLLEAKS